MARWTLDGGHTKFKLKYQTELAYDISKKLDKKDSN